MKKFKYFKLTLALILFFHLITFAQNPGDFGGTPDLNPTDAPVNKQLWVLIVIGIGYAFHKAKSSLHEK
ncbi:MAG: hypothetical protein RL308_574 [Bacteroidota bacterium]|jgi:hypothetical protein